MGIDKFEGFDRKKITRLATLGETDISAYGKRERRIAQRRARKRDMRDREDEESRDILAEGERELEEEEEEELLKLEIQKEIRDGFDAESASKMEWLTWGEVFKEEYLSGRLSVGEEKDAAADGWELDDEASELLRKEVIRSEVLKAIDPIEDPTYNGLGVSVPIQMLSPEAISSYRVEFFETAEQHQMSRELTDGEIKFLVFNRISPSLAVHFFQQGINSVKQMLEACAQSKKDAEQKKLPGIREVALLLSKEALSQEEIDRIPALLAFLYQQELPSEFEERKTLLQYIRDIHKKRSTEEWARDMETPRLYARNALSEKAEFETKNISDKIQQDFWRSLQSMLYIDA